MDLFDRKSNKSPIKIELSKDESLVEELCLRGIHRRDPAYLRVEWERRMKVALSAKPDLSTILDRLILWLLSTDAQSLPCTVTLPEGGEEKLFDQLDWVRKLYRDRVDGKPIDEAMWAQLAVQSARLQKTVERWVGCPATNASVTALSHANQGCRSLAIDWFVQASALWSADGVDPSALRPHLTAAWLRLAEKLLELIEAQVPSQEVPA